MYQSPRIRRLHNDLAALERLRSESSVFRFTAQGDPPLQYMISFKGKGLWRDRGKVRVLEDHRIEIKLGSSYPRTIPEIRWITPIYHPNISEIGLVCLGGYGTHWVPSVQLDELCVMLWDMARYHNYDIRSPYNREAALWVANQTTFLFPTDPRPLRDLRAAMGRSASPGEPNSAAASSTGNGVAKGPGPQNGSPNQGDKVRQFISRYGRVFNTSRTVVPETTETINKSEQSKYESRRESKRKLLRELLAKPTSDDDQDSSQGSKREELVILESEIPSQPPIAVAHPAADDILFIE